jgi:hypothetical protein
MPCDCHDEIKGLRSEIAAARSVIKTLRAALGRIRDLTTDPPRGDVILWTMLGACNQIARALLAPPEGGTT